LFERTNNNKHIMVQFTDLPFEPAVPVLRNGDPNAVLVHYDFPHGYSVSVVRNRYSYGGPRGLYELALMCTLTGDIVYDTPVTPDHDVLGSLTEADVTRVLQQVEALPPRVVEDTCLQEALHEAQERGASLGRRLRETEEERNSLRREAQQDALAQRQAVIDALENAVALQGRLRDTREELRDALEEIAHLRGERETPRRRRRPRRRRLPRATQ
jgi:hypothetical protein